MTRYLAYGYRRLSHRMGAYSFIGGPIFGYFSVGHQFYRWTDSLRLLLSGE